MSDLGDLARQVDDRMRNQVRLAPAEDLMAAARRRIRRRRAFGAIAVVVMCAFVAVAATPVWRHAPAKTVASPPRLQHRIVLDGGALVLDPLGKSQASARVTEVQARAVASEAQMPAVGVLSSPVLARVTADVQGRPVGVPAAWQLAWVQLYLTNVPGAASACLPRMGSPAPTPSGGPTNQNALIIDATTGAAASYLAYGGPCPPASAPQLAQALAEYSVPFDVRKGDVLAVHLPPCAALAYEIIAGPTSGGDVPPSPLDLSPGQVRAVAHAPIGPCDGSPSVKTVRLSGHLAGPLSHAPVGQFLLVNGQTVLGPLPSR